MGHTTLSATSSIVTLLEPSRRQTGRRDWRASSVLPPRRTWAIGLHNPSLPPPTPSFPNTHTTLIHSRWPIDSRPGYARSLVPRTSSKPVDQTPPPS